MTIEKTELQLKVEEDLWLAKVYGTKARNAEERGIEFLLTYKDFLKLQARKRCMYTGKLFKRPGGRGEPFEQLKKTYERVDNSVGYTKENTIVVCHFANKFKAVWEDKRIRHLLTLDTVTKIVTNTNKFTNKLKGN